MTKCRFWENRYLPIEYSSENLQSKEGYFIRFLKEEVPMKKKTAVGVRGMKLGESDLLEAAYLLEGRTEYTIDYRDRKLTLNRLKLAKRDGKGTKSRT